MVVDENLNDHSEEIINSWKKLFFQRKRLCIAYEIMFFVVFICLIVCCTIGLKDKSTIKQLTAQLQQDEQIISLEQSIGYWFTHKSEEVNDSILYQFLLDNNAWYPDVLFKQAKLESGNYSSNIYKTNNNLYGMKKPYKRSTTQSGENKGYGVYQNWCLSVLDRLLWDYYYFDEKPTEEEYLFKLQLYAEDSSYISKIK